MNQFYANPDQIRNGKIELTDQEASHASKVLRKGVGSEIFITNGAGVRYRGEIESVGKRKVLVAIKETQRFEAPHTEIVLALGLIKKRDRLEFAVEKGVELGISEFILFKGDHTEPFRVRRDRVEAAVLSATKQSLRVYKPTVNIQESLDSVMKEESSGVQFIHADQQGDADRYEISAKIKRAVLVVGPEGGLSERERGLLEQKHAHKLRLGDYRLRAETAAIVMAARFGNSREVRL